jgi:hypothetical protein
MQAVQNKFQYYPSCLKNEEHLKFGQKNRFNNNGSSISCLSQFLLLHQRPLKMTLAIKVVKIDLKIITIPLQSKSATKTALK